MCEHVDKKLTFRASQLEDGDIICLQKPLQPGTVKCRYPNVPSFLEYVHNRQVVRFRSLEKPKEDEFLLELSKLNNYDDVVERVASHLSLDDPSKIRLTSHNCYSQQPKPQPIKYRGVEHLSDMLAHYNQGETLAEVKVRIQKKLQVPDEEFSKWKFAFLSLGRPTYLQDADVVSTRFQRRDVYGAWEQYLGLEHSDNASKRSYAANQQVQNFGEPFFLVIREGETLAEVKTSDILYYEVLDIPLPELQGLKTLKVAFHHATKDEVVIHTIRLPKQSTVGDVINDLKTKVELSHKDAELRLLEVFYHKIYKIFPLNEKIENINDQYWTLRAEEIPEEEKDLGPQDRLIHVYHFTKDASQNQVQVQNFGEPFFLVIREGETLAEVKVRIQKKLQVPDEEFSKKTVPYTKERDKSNGFGRIDHATPRKRGGEYYDPVYFQSTSIIHQTTGPYTPQQNGVAERKNRTLKEMANSMLSYSGLSESFEVDADKDFKENMLRDYYCWLKTYCCLCKLRLLDDAAGIKLRLLEQSAAAVQIISVVQIVKTVSIRVNIVMYKLILPQVVSAAKLPILNPNEFDLWKMRIEQYFLMTDYSLWEVILNGDALFPTRVIEGVVQPVALTIAEQKLAKKNELKARGTLLMALPDKHKLKFNIHKDAKTLMEAIEKRFGGNRETKKVQKTLLKQQYENFTSSSSESLDQIHDRLTNESVSAVASVTATSAKVPVYALPNMDTFSNVVIYSFFASQSNSPQLDNDDLKQIDADDLEEIDLKWQMAMLTMRARSPKDTRRNVPAETQRRNVPVKTSTSNALVLQYDGIFMPPKPDLVFHDAPNVTETVHTAFNVELTPTKPNKDLSQSNRPSAFIIEDWVSDLEDESEAEPIQNAPSFVYPPEHVKTPRPSVKTVEHPIPAETLKQDIPNSRGHRNSQNKKELFICKSLTHLIKDCDYYKKQMVQKPVRNHAMRGNTQHYDRMTNPQPHRHVVPTTILTKSRLVPLTAARPITTTVLQPHVTRPRPVKNVVPKSHSPPRRNINRRPSPKPSNFPQKVTTHEVSQGNPHHALKDKGVIDSGCSRHMIGSMSYLLDFEAINGGYVTFGGNLKGGKITGKGKIKTGKLDFDDVYFSKELKFNLFSVSQMCDKKNSVLFTDTECIVLSSDFKLPDESHVLLRVPRENNMYNVDLKNIVPSGDLTCLFAKATLDESNLWHRRLGHFNFKTMNKLVKGNLVRGLPSKVFKYNHICVACKKGKQHRASCKTKPVSYVSQPLQRLHMDLFGPTFVKSLNKKSYCLVVTHNYSRFSWVFFLATKGETSPILKTFITGIENQLSLKEKIIRSDNGTEFKNHDLYQFCRMKGIKREFSVARTPQQNGIAKRKNMTLIEAARTMLADSLLPIPFWAEAVNTACYVQNRVLVTKPHNKTPYKLLHGRIPSIGFMRPFDCPVTILNTLDPLGKFDGKVDDGFLVGYYVSSKAFRVFNSRTRIVQETLHINFLENKPDVAGSGPLCLFDIDTLTKSRNYQPVSAGNQPNPSAGVQALFDAEKAGEGNVQQYENEFEVEKPESEVHVSPSSSAKANKRDDKIKREAKGKSPIELFTGVRKLIKEFEYFTDNSTNEVNDASSRVFAVGQISTNSTNTFSAAGPFNTAVSPTLRESSYVNPSQYPDDLNIPALEDITYSDDEENVGAEADFTNLETTITVNQGGPTQINNDDFHTCMFACFLSQEEHKRVHQALKDPSWIKAMQEELLQFKMQKVWVLVDLPKGKRAIGTKWGFKNKKNERGIIVRNKARLVAQGHVQEEGINYEEVFASVAKIESIRLFLAYASFMGFMVYQMDVKSAFFYGTIKEKVYVCQPPGFEEPDYPDKLCEAPILIAPDWDMPFELMCDASDFTIGAVLGQRQDKHFRPIHYASKTMTEAESKYTIMKDKFQMISMGELNFFLGLQVKQKPYGIFISQDKYVAEILRKFGLIDGKSAGTPIDTEKPLLKDPDGEDVDVHTYRYVKGKPHLGLWYPKYSPFNLVAYSDSDYAGASLDRKSTTEGCQFFGCILISWQCKKQRVVATSSTEAEYVAAASCCAQVLWIQNQLLDYERKMIITKDTVRESLHLDDAESVDCLPNEEICTELARIGLVRNVYSSSKFYMYPRFLQLMIRAQVGDFSSHTTKYSSPALTQKQADDVVDEVAAGVDVDDVPTADAEPTLPAPTPTTQPPPPLQELPSTSQGGIITDIDADKDVTLEEVAAKDAAIEENANDDESELDELKKVVEVVTTAKLMTKVVTAVAATITAATTPILLLQQLLLLLTEAQTRKNMMIYLKNMVGFKLDYFKGMSYDAIHPIFKKYFNSNVAFLEKTKEHLEEEESRALKRTSESLEKKAAKKQKLNEEIPIVDYEIYTENNKPYYMIKRADGSHQLFLSFLSLLRNFDREDLEARCLSSNMEESKKCLWFSKCQNLETVRVLWSAYHNIYNYTDDLAGREKISIDKHHFVPAVLTLHQQHHPTVLTCMSSKPNDYVSVNSIIQSKDAIFDEERFTSIPRPRGMIQPSSSKIAEDEVEGTNDVPGPYVPRKSTRTRKAKSFGSNFQLYLVEETRDKTLSQREYCFIIKEDPRTLSEAMASRDVAF
uniref:ubiquitinyl hydrolase 1 n=2 Tax=Magnoliopsida TaxID=3398 RepID=A0A6L2P7F5_TANCI|nr:putative ribonuclease H-like domain-containing protein [Tanacetum cinerariifolium]